MKLFLPVLFLISAPYAASVCRAQPVLDIEPGTQLSWDTIIGNTYQLQQASQPGGPWTDIGTAEAGDGATHYHYDPSGSRFHRIAETVPGIPPAPQLPFNSGFEDGTGNVPEHWSTSATYTPIRSNTDAHSGSYCIDAEVNAGGKEGILSQNIGNAGGSVTGGTSYDFSFWAKQGDVGPSFVQQYEVQWLNTNNDPIGGTGLKNFSASTAAWTKISPGAATAPSAAVNARIKFRFATGTVAGARGRVLIDDVQLASETSSPVSVPEETNYLPLVGQAVSRISWPTVVGVPYQARSTTDFDVWEDIDPVILGDGTVRDVLIPIEGKNAEFYRVEYPGPPDGVDPEAGVIALFDSNTVLEAPTTIETPTALKTYIADRARDRHAREAEFNSYDHYLSWYWEQRVANIEIIDYVAKGGTEIVFNYTTHDSLSAAEFRTFFGGVTTPAQYNNNQRATLVSVTPSATPGETDYNYTAKINQNANEGNRPLQIGDRVEIELSQFLASPRNGRNNYYGTTMLYVVGTGIVPWGQGNDLGFPGGVVGNVRRDKDSHPLPTKAWLGGQTTLPYQYSNEPEHRFKQTAGNISPTNGGPFMLGRRLHHTDFGNGVHSEVGNPIFSAQTGKLGPDFISRSCVECHTNNGRALPPQIGEPMFKTVVKVGSDAEGAPHPVLGSVLQPRTTGGSAEAIATIASYVTSGGQYGDGTPYSLRKPTYAFQGVTPTYFSARLAPQLVGLGLLEAIDEQTIVDLADPDDENEDGISGRYQIVTDPETEQPRLGRFTPKSGQARLSHQIAAALNTDMGITTSVFPMLDGETSAGAQEVSDTELDQMTRYVALLGVGARRDLNDPQAIAGEQLFATANCTACHTPELTTGPFHPMTELRNQTINPYTDLLLHDMGPGLADNMGENGASGSEWRTPPLWNIGLTAGVSGGEAYLHDGRARTLEEAILWHGGEAEASKESFRTMSSADREALIKFLKSL